MKKTAILLMFLAVAIIAAASPAKPKKPKKPKYKVLAAMYEKCTADLSYTTSERNDFEKRNNVLTSELTAANVQIAQLKIDTTENGRRIRIAERNLEKTKRDYDDLSQSLSSDLSARQKELNDLKAKLAQKDADVKALKNRVVEALKGFVELGLTIRENNGKVFISLDEKLLFASGSWDIDNKGKEALLELGKVLANDPNINIAIEGHTDNVPYRGSGAVKDNWDLSVMRATAVVKDLLKNAGINPKLITASGRGEFIPIDIEDSKEARAKNRRIEIILTLQLDELFQLIDWQ
jgi:chemotaxis protein MotB